MKKPIVFLIASLAVVLCFSACNKSPEAPFELRSYPVNNVAGVITQTGVNFDKEITADGNGSLRIAVDKPTVIRLYETGDIDVEDARITYKAKVRAKDVQGKAYLEMWCSFTGKGEYFSRGLQSPISGTTDWATLETPFFLKKGENPDNIKINLVIDGTGVVWIDDIRLIKSPLH